MADAMSRSSSPSGTSKGLIGTASFSGRTIVAPVAWTNSRRSLRSPL